MKVLKCPLSWRQVPNRLKRRVHFQTNGRGHQAPPLHQRRCACRASAVCYLIHEVLPPCVCASSLSCSVHMFACIGCSRGCRCLFVPLHLKLTHSVAQRPWSIRESIARERDRNHTGGGARGANRCECIGIRCQASRVAVAQQPCQMGVSWYVPSLQKKITLSY